MRSTSQRPTRRVDLRPEPGGAENAKGDDTHDLVDALGGPPRSALGPPGRRPAAGSGTMVPSSQPRLEAPGFARVTRRAPWESQVTIANSTEAPLQHTDKFFIGGEWVEPSSSNQIDVICSV